MINNRQAGRRNRGRNNNGRPNGNNRGGGDNGNRIDNRARGNAAQLLEKYKNMARDAQMAGDRVNAEYYLQFADHYFRVLADNRARQEEQQQRFRPREDSFDEDGDDFDGADEGMEDFRGEQPAYDRAPRHQERRPEEGRDNRDGNRNNRRDRNRRDRFSPQEDGGSQPEIGFEGPAGTPADSLSAAQAVEAPAADTPEQAVEAVRPRRGRPRKAAAPAESAESFDAAVLPPSIARNEDAATEEGDAPRKRVRRPRATTAEAAE
ncbi:DUF4167 domain-containing protein [Sphingobium sp. CCH11-B1]|uniref:DUF4167 domain-containing protein n=1 Tax=Sphingobium sp. CCH11-B1 TaxID=1768781 RepID=UPI00082DF08E|nr:DUF4167 domain-containing protein [Sphingobium sp. CCH11-B1]MEA3389498.1 DUF4167 domain-containing protein [Pseudomonadota bacterium]